MRKATRWSIPSISSKKMASVMVLERTAMSFEEEMYAGQAMERACRPI